MLYASDGPDLIWAGGGMKVSNQSNPCYFADSFVFLGQIDETSLFSQPMVTLRGEKLGFDIGIGGRQPMLSGLMLGGGNLFFDYTANHSHERFGAGLEVYHPNFSGHMNFYLPLSGEHDNEEALPGVDLTFDIPIPNAPFVSLWPGVYYYAGRDRENMGGLSMMVQVQPIKPLFISFGGRNDTLQAGKDKGELFFKVELSIPFQRLGKDMFVFNYGKYPLEVRSQMDHRVVREDFITFENKAK